MTDDRRETQGRLDELAALDPLADRERFERLIGGIRRAALPELMRRRRLLGVWGEFARWRRAVLAGAGALALASLLVFAFVRPVASTQTDAGGVLGVPDEWAAWLQSAENPGPGDLLTVGRSQP